MAHILCQIFRFEIREILKLMKERDEIVKSSIRRPSKFNEEVAAFEARIASVKKGFDAKLEGQYNSHIIWPILNDSYSMSHK